MNKYIYYLAAFALIFFTAGSLESRSAVPNDYPIKVGPPVHGRIAAPSGPPRLIVKYADSTAVPSDAEISQAIPGALRAKSFRIGPHRYDVLVLAKGSDAARAARALRSNPAVKWAEPDLIRTASELVPNDPYFTYQWHFQEDPPGSIYMGKAWEQVDGRLYNQVVVAVIDSGVAFESYRRFVISPDFTSDQFVAPWNFLTGTAHPNDDHGHGTHVSGTIAEKSNNSLGVAGIAGSMDTVKIMPLKVLNSQGDGFDSDVAAAIVYAADNGADIINLSLGGPGQSQVLADALAYASANDVLSFCAAGNEYLDGNPVNYPAADPNCVGVGAVDWGGARAPYSNTGYYVDLAAPGGNFDKDENGDGYVDGVLQLTIDPLNPASFGYYFYEGTSMATPHVAGTAALLMSIGSGDAIATRDQLFETARDAGPPGRDDEYGLGIVDMGAALSRLSDIDANSYYEDHSFFMTADRSEVYFAGNRPDEMGAKKTRLWRMERDPVTFEFLSPVLFPIFSPAEEAANFPSGYGLGAMTQSADRLEMYVTVLSGSTSEIWYSTRADVGSGWGAFSPLPLAMENASFAGPSITADGLKLFFSSDRPCTGCSQDFNLWMASRSASTPPADFAIDPASETLLAAVNSHPPAADPKGFNEILPAVSPDGLALSFAADWGSVSGSTAAFAIYLAERTSTADPFGAPITPAGLAEVPGVYATSFIDTDGRALYVAVNRNNGRGLDIYLSMLDHGAFTRPGILPSTGSRPVVCGVIYDLPKGAPPGVTALAMALPLLVAGFITLLIRRKRT